MTNFGVIHRHLFPVLVVMLLWAILRELEEIERKIEHRHPSM